MTPLEKDLEKKLVSLVRQRGGLALKWVCPGWAGVPDRIVLLPGGRIVFVEMKRPKGGVLSERQRWWRKKLIELGFHHWILWELTDLTKFEEWEL